MCSHAAALFEDGETEAATVAPAVYRRERWSKISSGGGTMVRMKRRTTALLTLGVAWMALLLFLHTYLADRKSRQRLGLLGGGGEDDGRRGGLAEDLQVEQEGMGGMSAEELSVAMKARLQVMGEKEGEPADEENNIRRERVKKVGLFVVFCSSYHCPSFFATLLFLIEVTGERRRKRSDISVRRVLMASHLVRSSAPPGRLQHWHTPYCQINSLKIALFLSPRSII